MENTACGQNCPFVKQGFCKDDKECPHFVQTVWETVEGETKFLNDCSPKRMVLQQQYMQSRLDVVQSALIESRNEYIELKGHLGKLIGMCQTIIVENADNKKMEIENESDSTLLID